MSLIFNIFCYNLKYKHSWSSIGIPRMFPDSLSEPTRALAPSPSNLSHSTTSIRVRRSRTAREGGTPRIAFQYSTARPSRLSRQRDRIAQFQQRWQRIKDDLPPQLTRRHSESRIISHSIYSLTLSKVGMISIGGVIGTGLFLGSAVRI